MNILFMADTPANPDSGASGTEYQTINALRELGADVDVVWADELRHRIKHGNLHHILEQPFEYRRVMLAKLSKKKYDVVHINQPHGYLVAKILAPNRDTVCIHRSHGFELRVESDLDQWRKLYGEDSRNSVRRLLSKGIKMGINYNCRAIGRYADGHIVSARQCADFLHDRMGVCRDRIAVIPQAPPLLYITASQQTMDDARLKNILYVGQYDFVKAPMILAEAMNRIAETNDNVRFTWVCSRGHHGRVLSLLSEKTKSRLTLSGWLPQAELLKIYDRHGIFLFPSFFEGFGKVFLEAMSRGLCVIAADNGGAHDIIRNGENGILVPTGDVGAMADTCLRMVNDLKFAQRMSLAAAKVAGTYTWQRTAELSLDFYRRRLEAKKAGDGSFR